MDEQDLLYGPQEPEPEHQVKKEDPQITALHKAVSDIETRLRVLEERYANLRKKTQITDQNMLETEKHLDAEVRTAHESLNRINDTLGDVQSKLALFSSEFAMVAKRSDLNVVERYLDLWQPLQFVTREEVRIVLKDLFGKK